MNKTLSTDIIERSRSCLKLSLALLTIIVLFLALGGTAYGVEYAPDANTVLLDHFDGTTNADVPVGNLIYVPSLPGLGQAAELSKEGDLIVRYAPPNLPSIMSSGTIEFWANIPQYPFPSHQLDFLRLRWYWTLYEPGGGCVGGVDVLGEGNYEEGYRETGAVHFGVWGAWPAPMWNMSSTTKIPLNQWVHIAVVWDDSFGTRIYMNGDLIAVYVYKLYPNWPQYVYMGSFIGQPRLYNYQIDELRISNIARTQSEIMDHVLANLDSTGPAPSILSPVEDAGVYDLVSVNAVIDDRLNGNSNVVDAQYCVDDGIWNQMAATDGVFDSTVENVTANIDMTSFVPGAHAISVRGKDSAGNWGDSAIVNITVLTKLEIAQEAVEDVKDVIIGLPSNPLIFQNVNNQNALSNKIDAVIILLDTGRYQEALDKLKNDIIKKTDGWATIGKPDNNDWIKDTETQKIVYPYLLDLIERVEDLV